MSYLVIQRPARIAAPPLPRGELKLVPPPSPTQPPPGAAQWLQYVLPVMGSGGAMLFALLNPKPLFIVASGLFALGSVGMGIGMYVQQRSGRRGKAADDRRRYLEYLTRVRARLREVARAQRVAAAWRHPDPADLWTIALCPERVWERRPGDDDFLDVRVGLGPRPLATRPVLELDEGPAAEYEPVSLAAARRLVERQGTVAEQPVTVPLPATGVLSVVGQRAVSRAVARALVCQLAAFHAPDDLRMAFCFPPAANRDWQWVKWLPHARHPNGEDGPDPARMIAADLAELDELLGRELEARRARRRAREAFGGALEQGGSAASAAAGPSAAHLLVVVDVPAGLSAADSAVLRELTAEPHTLDVTVVVLADQQRDEPSTVDLRARVSPVSLELEAAGGAAAATSSAGATGLPWTASSGSPARSASGTVGTGRPDLVSPVVAEALARRLAPLRLSPEELPERALAESRGLPALLGIDDVATIDPRDTWRPRPLHDFLRVPIGVTAGGDPLELDLKESALGGMGPHGLAVGATGSGKSELLRTLVTALAITHPPELLAFVLVDFKGGATFAPLAPLPHVAGVITNLQDDLAMVDRMHAALFGELQRRQELLRAAGNLPSIRDYHQRLSNGAPSGSGGRNSEAPTTLVGVPGPPSWSPPMELEPLPFLLVVIDELSELLASRPEFIDLFVAIGRLGRSLGMHLLFASQRLEEGRLRGLESHLSYRIGLRTFSAAESRAVLGVPDAHTLPAIPGSAYLKVDPEVFERFKAAIVSNPYQPTSAAAQEPVAVTVAPFTAHEQRPRDRETVADGAPGRASGSDFGPGLGPGAGAPSGPSVMDVAVRRLAGAAERVHQVWLPPLPPAIPLDRLLPPPAYGAFGDADGDRHGGYGGDDPGGALVAAMTGAGTRLRVRVGLLDEPEAQRQQPLVLDFRGASGHLAVVGSPQSGKSTLLRTLIASFMLTHTPEEVQFYCIDLGGGTLQALAGAPHVGTVTGRRDPERVRRVIGTVAALLDDRERLFLSHGIDSVQTFRQRHAAGHLPDEEHGDVFLVLDNWSAIRQEFEDLEPLVVDLAARGLGYGIHLVVTAGRWLDIRPNLRDSIGGRLELRLTDPLDSEIGRKEAENVPVGVPGRGLTVDKLHFQAALPRIDGQATAARLQEAVKDLVSHVKGAWHGRAARPVHVLPGRLRPDELPAPGEDVEPGVPIGVAETDLAPVYLDLRGSDPHLLVFGDGESGKTTLLRWFVHALTAREPPERAKVLLVDYRRTLLDAVGEQHLAGYAGAAPAATAMIEELRAVLEGRLPGTDLTVRQLRERSWWSGPEVYVVVDDYDLVVTPSGNPLTPLLDLLAQGRDIGFHLLLARRVGGASRALFEPVLQRVKELGSPGLILSGDPDEGPLLGPHRAMPRVPGRALLVRRQHRSVLLQTPWLPAPE